MPQRRGGADVEVHPFPRTCECGATASGHDHLCICRPVGHDEVQIRTQSYRPANGQLQTFTERATVVPKAGSVMEERLPVAYEVNMQGRFKLDITAIHITGETRSVIDELRDLPGLQNGEHHVVVAGHINIEPLPILSRGAALVTYISNREP